MRVNNKNSVCQGWNKNKGSSYAQKQRSIHRHQNCAGLILCHGSQVASCKHISPIKKIIQYALIKPNLQRQENSVDLTRSWHYAQFFCTVALKAEVIVHLNHELISFEYHLKRTL